MLATSKQTVDVQSCSGSSVDSGAFVVALANSYRALEIVFFILLTTPSLSVGVGRMFESFCLFVCPQRNSTRRMATANKTCVSGKN